MARGRPLVQLANTSQTPASLLSTSPLIIVSASSLKLTRRTSPTSKFVPDRRPEHEIHREAASTYANHEHSAPAGLDQYQYQYPSSQFEVPKSSKHACTMIDVSPPPPPSSTHCISPSTITVTDTLNHYIDYYSSPTNPSIHTQ
ncbi:hypothetical protein NEOLEDRAFT_754974 [Neolentinus lepideus HHB14362 ss-1]|uniref:Uncharacterized protein n=1 Tax=Neolentinus lepideus HHB14362 ss-1 TaxID=1314782 RepID=A0A165PQL0_9AGAM|nr:hypothetical protein NEOLEDRAFT_754974 [Neolentinus lepideus HHB14362 ss-1]